MILLAHRGLWRSPQEKNSRQAFRDAFAGGYGVELDVRDAAGALLISHDPVDPVLTPLPFIDVLADYAAAGMPGRIAVNVKADGLSGMIQAALDAFPGAAERSFVFDMSVPELIRYVRTDLIAFTRQSDYEPEPTLLDRAAGIWLDCFDIPWVEPADILKTLRQGKDAAIVSPELHGRPHLEFWELLRAMLASQDAAGLDVAERLLLCTDFPDEAKAFFGEARADRPSR